jgi:hypothetical protein
MSRSHSIPRRRFVKLALAGAAAVAAAPLARAAEAATRVRPAPPRDGRKPAPSALRRELENQTRTVAAIAKAIREYPLPAGSPPAPVFRAMPRPGRRP